MSICKSCGQIIDWVKTRGGKVMPVNPDYIDYEDAMSGDLLVMDDGDSIKVRSDDDGDKRGIRGRVSHFATCSEAESWRRK